MINMKRILMTVAVSSLLFTGCKTAGSLSGTDDVYANPAEEKRLALAAAEEKARQEALQRQDAEKEAAAKEEERKKQENNPYYKDPDYNKDDYYDYEYASRLNRFHNPIPGASYYDPYYTNLYTYNQNPMFWGTSIYSCWGMPSTTFGMYSMGISTGWRVNPYMSVGMSWGNSMCYPWGYGTYYNPYCYSGFYDPWYSPWGYGSSFYSGYNTGYYNGFYNGYRAGQYGGYYNSMDPNSGYKSVHYGRRGQSIGGNSPGRRGAGVSSSESQRVRYMENVATQQENTPRFTERQSTSRRTYNSSSSGNREQNRSIQPASPEGQRSGRRSDSRRTYESGSRRQQQTEPRRQQQQRSYEPSNNRSGGTINQSPSNSGNRNSTSPRNTGGSGGRTRSSGR